MAKRFRVGDTVKLSPTALESKDIRERFPAQTGLKVHSVDNTLRRQYVSVTHPDFPGWIVRDFDPVYFTHK